MTISNPGNSWGKVISYVSGTDGTSLTVDGVLFKILDFSHVQVDFKALGLSGVEVTATHKVTYKSTEQEPDSFLTVTGKQVAIREGELFWGGESLGQVGEGDVFLADEQGLRVEP
jgi:hypothetical protein